MPRRLKSPTRTISNSGPIPRFIGYFPCSKAAGAYLPFDSMSALMVGVFLEWRRTVAGVEFEPLAHSHEGEDGVT